MWNTSTGDELLTLDGHRNVVYAIAFNNPWGDKIITGSFDKTCKLWNAEVRNGVGIRCSQSTEQKCVPLLLLVIVRPGYGLSTRTREVETSPWSQSQLYFPLARPCTHTHTHTHTTPIETRLRCPNQFHRRFFPH